MTIDLYNKVFPNSEGKFFSLFRTDPCAVFPHHTKEPVRILALSVFPKDTTT